MHITITRAANGSFMVVAGEKLADGLAVEEMLGLVAALTITEPRRCLGWLHTPDEWREQARGQAERIAEIRTAYASGQEVAFEFKTNPAEAPVDLGQFGPGLERVEFVDAGGCAPPVGVVEDDPCEEIHLDGYVYLATPEALRRAIAEGRKLQYNSPANVDPNAPLGVNSVGYIRVHPGLDAGQALAWQADGWAYRYRADAPATETGD